MTGLRGVECAREKKYLAFKVGIFNQVFNHLVIIAIMFVTEHRVPKGISF